MMMMIRFPVMTIMIDHNSWYYDNDYNFDKNDYVIFYYLHMSSHVFWEM